MIATACKKAKKRGLLRANFPIFFVIGQSLKSFKNTQLLLTILHSLWRTAGFLKNDVRCHGNHRQTLFAHFRQVLHAFAQYDQARTVFHWLKKRLEMSNLCCLSLDQTVTFSDLAHGLTSKTLKSLKGFIGSDLNESILVPNHPANVNDSQTSGYTTGFSSIASSFVLFFILLPFVLKK